MGRGRGRDEKKLLSLAVFNSPQQFFLFTFEGATKDGVGRGGVTAKKTNFIRVKRLNFFLFSKKMLNQEGISGHLRSWRMQIT